MPDARDELIERIARALHGNPDLPHWGDFLEEAEAALSVVETATNTCPECNGHEPERGDHDWGLGPCPSCKGQPGPLLVLLALGGESVQGYFGTVSSREPDAMNVDADPRPQTLWRFPRRQEGR